MPLTESSAARFESAELAAILGKTLDGDAFTVCGFSTDTRTIEAGNCFIALKGESFNGNLYAQTAAEKGAVLCILTEAPAQPLPIPYLLVDDAVKAYGLIANAYIQRLKRQGAKVLAVTGSSGKTTVKDMTAYVLSKAFRTYCTEGNHNNHIGVPFTILHAPADTQILVLEMGMNHKGEISSLTRIGNPDMATITNIGNAHVGNLGSQENIFRAKLEIVEGMDAEKGLLFFPAQDAFLQKAEQIPFPKERIRYSTRLPQETPFASLYADEIHEGGETTHFTVHLGNEAAEVLLPMTGIHNVSNALLAIHAGLECGMNLPTCAAALADFVPTALRSDRVTLGNLTVIRDFYNANPEAMACSLNALRLAANGTDMIALLGNMNELGAHAPLAHRTLGETCKAMGVQALFCGENYRDFAAGYGEDAAAFSTRDELIAALPQLFPRSTAAYVLIKASRGLQMEYVFDALQKLSES